jgi:CHAT domain-containing protein
MPSAQPTGDHQGFQLAGYPHVIGTLWEIDDGIAVEVAESFYRELRSDDRLVDVRRSAHAISQAVRAVRARYPESPDLWAAYIHAGA